jgi:poly-gamma-glutamate synthase PgsB/CapB
MSAGQLQLAIGLGSFTLYMAFLAAERVLLKMARRKLRLVIHVNGTRGKSTVTRMVHSILREAGYQAWGKTTGTEPRLLLPDGGERLIRRLGPANVREQRNKLLAAVRGGADALVFECNAVRPELQLVSSAFLDPDLLVITNARLDHGSEQGDADTAARSFAATIPAGKSLASSDTVHKALWEEEAAKKAARFVFVDPGEGEGLGDLPENVSCAFAVSDWLGLPRDRAAKAIQCHKPDPGAFRLYRWTGNGGQRVWFADALAANDPESSDRLAQRALASAEKEGMGLVPTYELGPVSGNIDRLLLVALRRDRPERTRLFVDYALERCLGAGSVRYDKVVFAGSIPGSERRRLVEAGVKAEIIRFSGKKTLLTRLGSQVDSSSGDIFIAAVGNRVGCGTYIHDWAAAKAESLVSGRIDTAAKEASLES